MGSPLSRCNVAVVALLVASHTLAAQAPSIRHSASLDLAALADGELHASIQPLVVGRSAFGVSLARWWGGGPVYAVPLGAELVAPSVSVTPHPAREYMVDLSARVYPLSLSSAQAGHRISGYLGGFLGFHRRELDETIQQPCVLEGGQIICPLAGSSGSSVIPCLIPCQPPPGPQIVHAISNGFEPGAELGVRVTPLGDLFFELGGWARMITFSDPTGRFEDGQVDARLTIAVGFGW